VDWLLVLRAPGCLERARQPIRRATAPAGLPVGGMATPKRYTKDGLDVSRSRNSRARDEHDDEDLESCEPPRSPW
jgi:hypothetical protein